ATRHAGRSSVGLTQAARHGRVCRASVDRHAPLSQEANGTDRGRTQVPNRTETRRWWGSCCVKRLPTRVGPGWRGDDGPARSSERTGAPGTARSCVSRHYCLATGTTRRNNGHAWCRRGESSTLSHRWPDEPQYPRDLFSGTPAYYARYRPGYPADFV